jgi:hypothetical protein
MSLSLKVKVEKGIQILRDREMESYYGLHTKLIGQWADYSKADCIFFL